MVLLYQQKSYDIDSVAIWDQPAQHCFNTWAAVSLLYIFFFAPFFLFGKAWILAKKQTWERSSVAVTCEITCFSLHCLSLLWLSIEASEQYTAI